MELKFSLSQQIQQQLLQLQPSISPIQQPLFSQIIPKIWKIPELQQCKALIAAIIFQEKRINNFVWKNNKPFNNHYANKYKLRQKFGYGNKNTHYKYKYNHQFRPQNNQNNDEEFIKSFDQNINESQEEIIDQDLYRNDEIYSRPLSKAQSSNGVLISHQQRVQNQKEEGTDQFVDSTNISRDDESQASYQSQRSSSSQQSSSSQTSLTQLPAGNTVPLTKQIIMNSTSEQLRKYARRFQIVLRIDDVVEVPKQVSSNLLDYMSREYEQYLINQQKQKSQSTGIFDRLTKEECQS